MEKSVDRVIEVIQVIQDGRYTDEARIMAGKELVYILQTEPEKVTEALRIIENVKSNGGEVA